MRRTRPLPMDHYSLPVTGVNHPDTADYTIKHQHTFRY